MSSNPLEGIRCIDTTICDNALKTSMTILDPGSYETCMRYRDSGLTLCSNGFCTCNPQYGYGGWDCLQLYPLSYVIIAFASFIAVTSIFCCAWAANGMLQLLRENRLSCREPLKWRVADVMYLLLSLSTPVLFISQIHLIIVVTTTYSNKYALAALSELFVLLYFSSILLLGYSWLQLSFSLKKAKVVAKLARGIKVIYGLSAFLLLSMFFFSVFFTSFAAGELTRLIMSFVSSLYGYCVIVIAGFLIFKYNGPTVGNLCEFFENIIRMYTQPMEPEHTVVRKFRQVVMYIIAMIFPFVVLDCIGNSIMFSARGFTQSIENLEHENLVLFTTGMIITSIAKLFIVGILLRHVRFDECDPLESASSRTLNRMLNRVKGRRNSESTYLGSRDIEGPNLSSYNSEVEILQESVHIPEGFVATC